MHTIPRRPRAIPVSIARTCGLFRVPVVMTPPHLVELRVYLSNFDRSAATADITVNEEGKWSKEVCFRTNLLVPSMGTRSQRLDVTEKEGHIIEVELALSSDLVKPSLELVLIGGRDGSEAIALFLPPSAFTRLRVRGASPIS